MVQRTAKSMKLYKELCKRGYPEEFSEQITLNLNTDYTAKRMLGYLSHYKKLPMEEVVDEMFAILTDRDAIIRKKESERANAKINKVMLDGLDN